ncbi:MAG: TonB-dependent receptor, partial [Sphingomonas bacterium]|nr:TonB-dependent receptor [Sphingomonas bacterium]
TSQDVNRQNFINAVNVTTNAQGQVVCTATPAVQAAPGGTPIADPNCVPLNLLGFNQSSPEARAYIIAQNDTYSKLVQKVFNANVGGTPFSLFGNDQAFNVGYEHREEEGSFTPSAFQQQGLGRSSPVGALSGKYNVDEVFGEALLTLVSPVNDLKFLNRLEIFGRGRYVDNTVNGGFFSWAAGGRISPIRDITFRGNYTKSFRAPAITELFLPISPAFSSVPDLCSPGNINGGAAPATRNANCTAFLTAFPNATPLDAASATVPSLSGGNLGLQNEVARSYTFGVIIEPRFIPGLAVTADYLDIDISNPISSLTVTQIATACFDNPNFNAADPANGNAFCSRLQRYPSGTTRTAANGGNAAGQVVNDPANPGVTSGFINGNRVYFSGIQGTVNYSTSLTGLGIPGRFSTGTTLFYVRRRIVDNTGVAPVRTDGVVGDPKFQAQANLRYANETFGLSSSVNVVGQQIATRTGLSPDLREFNKYPAYATVNGSVFFNVDKQFRLNFSVTNIGNKRAFPYYGGYVPVTTNNVDLLGRRFVMSARINY